MHVFCNFFYSWTPDVLTATGNYTRVKFPSCKSSQLRPANCDFTVNQLGKAMWMKMRTHTPEVHQVVVNMQFTQVSVYCTLGCMA